MNGCRRLLPLSSSNSTSPSPSSPPYNTASRCSQRPQTDRASTGKHLCCMTCLLSIPEVLKWVSDVLLFSFLPIVSCSVAALFETLHIYIHAGALVAILIRSLSLSSSWSVSNMCSSSSSLHLVVFHASSPSIIDNPSWWTATRDCHDRTSRASSIHIHHICKVRGKSKEITACQWITVSPVPPLFLLSLFPSLSLWAYFFVSFSRQCLPHRWDIPVALQCGIESPGPGCKLSCSLFVCSFRASCRSFFLSFIILDPACKNISTSRSSHIGFRCLTRIFLHFRIGFTKPVFIGISCYHHRLWLYLDKPLFFRLVRFHHGRRRAYSQGQRPRPSPGPACLHPGLQRYAIQHVAACNPRYAVSAVP